MNKLFIAILVLWVPLLAVADEAECTFPVGMVKQVPPAEPCHCCGLSVGLREGQERG